jgi:hypothetical protein
MKALKLFLESPLDLDAKEWKRRKKAAKEGARELKRLVRHEENKAARGRKVVMRALRRATSGG